MFIIMVVLFLLGYLAIALEHPIKVEKAASALLLGSILWALYALSSEQVLAMGFSPSWEELKHMGQQILSNIAPAMTPDQFATSPFRETVELAEHSSAFVRHELAHHLVDIAEILFFLFGAMTIVEVIDQHHGFTVITNRITTTSKVKLIWVIGIITFFMSSVLDNLTTTIVMIALLRKLISDKPTRWIFASMIVIAANAGGAWSPIGDVTTIMLWIGGQITTVNIMLKVFIPSLLNMIVPLTILSFMVRGEVKRPENQHESGDITYVGMLFGLGILWLVSEIMHRDKEEEIRKKLTIYNIVKKVDTPTIFFFLGILSAVAALQSAGHLSLLAGWLDEKLGDIYLINLAIGVISAVVDNVPLVAGAMGMYEVVTPDMLRMAADPAYAGFFVQDGLFWELLAYCAGTGGSMLIIGSAAGVAAMGLERIDFIWYMKKISWLALVGYLAGAGAYWVQAHLIH
jgi:Na+/H+ antiporter NhaD/arsenite permease-like protein